MIPRTKNFILCLWLLSSFPSSEASHKTLSLSAILTDEQMDELAYRQSLFSGSEEDQEISSPSRRKPETPSSSAHLDYNPGKARASDHVYLIHRVISEGESEEENRASATRTAPIGSLKENGSITCSAQTASETRATSHSPTIRVIDNSPRVSDKSPQVSNNSPTQVSDIYPTPQVSNSSPVPFLPSPKGPVPTPRKRFSFLRRSSAGVVVPGDGIKGGSIIDFPPINVSHQPMVVSKAPSPREDTPQLIRNAFPKLNTRQVDNLINSYTAIFPLPMSHSNPDHFASTIPLVVQLVSEIGNQAEYECIMDKLSEWELISGFVLDLSEKPARALLERMNRDAQEDAQLAHVLQKITTGDEEAMGSLREAARRQVVRSVGAASTIPIEAGETAAEGRHLRITGTQSDIFYYRGLLPVAALVAESFDGTHAQEIFNFLIRKRMAGVWGPRRDQLKQIYRGHFELNNDALTPENEIALLQYQTVEAMTEVVLKWIKEATEKDAKLNVSKISLLQVPLTKDLVKEKLLQGELKEVIDCCSESELALMRQFLDQINSEGGLAFRKLRKIREIKLRGLTLKRAHRGLPNSEPATEPKASSFLPRLPFTAKRVARGGLTNPKTLDQVVEGALRILEALKRHDFSIQIDRNLAYDKTNLRALRCLFLNIFPPESVKVLLFELLSLKEEKWLSRGGELVYAAYLLTAEKSPVPVARDNWFEAVMKEFKNIIKVLGRQPEEVLFSGLEEFNSALSDEGSSFYDSDSEDELIHV